MPLTITSANAVFFLAIAGVFPAPQQLQGFGVDEAFDTETADSAETQLGVDGVVTSGFLPRLTIQTITLQASSESFRVFDEWAAAQDKVREIMYASGVIHLPSIRRKFTMPQGTLTRYQALPNAKKVLQQRAFQITWGWPVVSEPL